MSHVKIHFQDFTYCCFRTSSARENHLNDFVDFLEKQPTATHFKLVTRVHNASSLLLKPFSIAQCTLFSNTETKNS